MNALYGLFPDAEGAQRAFDALRAATSELKFKAQQIVIVSGEPHEGYEFTDSQYRSTPYRWAVLGAVVGGTSRLFAHYPFAEVVSHSHRRHVPYARRGLTASSFTR